MLRPPLTMISVMVSSDSSGSIGPRPRISATICSNRRRRSGRDRTIFSSARIVSNSSSIVRRTSAVWLTSIDGSSSASSLFCTRDFNPWYGSRWSPPGAETRRVERLPPPRRAVPAIGEAAPGAAGAAAGAWPRALGAGGVEGWDVPCSIRFKSDTRLPPYRSLMRRPPLSGRKQARAFRLSLFRLFGVRRQETLLESRQQFEHVAARRAAAIGDEQRHAPVDRRRNDLLVGRDVPVDRALEIFGHRLGRNAGLAVHLVQDEEDAVPREVEGAQQIEDQPGILDGRDIRRRHQHH